MSSNKMSSPNQSLTNGDLLLASPASNSNQSQLNKSTNRPLKLRRVNHKDEIVFGFSSLLRNESMTDVTLICNGGQTIRAHRVILSTFSPYFRAIFEAQPFSNNPCQYPVIVIKDLELNELKTIIDFIYKGEVSVSRDKLQSVLQAAKALEVSGLADLKSDAFGVNSNAQTNSVNTLLANSLMNSPNTVNQSNLNDLNFGSLSALNYVCNLNNKRDNNSLNNSLDNDLFNENQLNRLRVSIEDSSELLNTLNTSLLGDNTVNIDGVRSLLQQPPRLPQLNQLNQLKQQQLNQLNQMKSQRQLQLLQQQQRQQLQRIQQHQQNRQLQQQQQQQNRQLQQQILQLNQNGNLKNKYSVPKNSLQGQNLVQFQEKIKQQIQEKQQQQQQQQQKSENTNGNDKSNSKDQDVEEIVDSNDMNENGDENGDDKLMDQNDQNDLIVDDENNNQINKLNEDGQLDDNKNSDDKNDDDLENGANGYVDYDESADPSQLNGDDEEYEIDINKDQFFQRQQQIRLEQLKNQQHFQQLQLLQVDDPENRSDFQKQLFQAVGLRNANDLNGDALNGRRNSSKDSLLQTSSASGSEDTDNDNNNDNTMDINDNLGDNLSIMENNFFDDYNNLTSGSPIPMQVKLSPQLNRIPQTPDFLLPRGPGRPRKGNKGSDISPCPECHKKFVRPDVLKLHYRSVHLLERHPCNMCEKVFKWPGDLSKHKRKSCKGRNLVV